jgi:hypothetical protein
MLDLAGLSSMLDLAGLSTMLDLAGLSSMLDLAGIGLGWFGVSSISTCNATVGVQYCSVFGSASMYIRITYYTVLYSMTNSLITPGHTEPASSVNMRYWCHKYLRRKNCIYIEVTYSAVVSKNM